MRRVDALTVHSHFSHTLGSRARLVAHRTLRSLFTVRWAHAISVLCSRRVQHSSVCFALLEAPTRNATWRSTSLVALLCAQEAEVPAADQKADAPPAAAEEGAPKAAEPVVPVANPTATTEQSAPAAE